MKGSEVLKKIREGRFELNPHVKRYIKGLLTAELEYGEIGVKTQIIYIFNNLIAKKGLQQQIKGELIQYANSK